MNTTASSTSVPARTGKIARLPLPLRDELNHRLSQNIPARELIAWLNALPAVRTILANHFHNSPINAQNISNWRRGGFAEWQARENLLSGLRTIAADAADIESALGSVTEHAARLLALHFTRILCPSETVRGKTRPLPDLPETTIKTLCQMSTAIAALRRGDIARTRLQLQQNSASPPTGNQAPSSQFKPARAPSVPRLGHPIGPIRPIGPISSAPTPSVPALPSPPSRPLHPFSSSCCIILKNHLAIPGRQLYASLVRNTGNSGY